MGSMQDGLSSEQHDDHIWLTVRGQGWAILGIERRNKTIIFRLWRGYAPSLEFSSVQMFDPDWEPYCEAAVDMLNEYWQTD
jgi:hypothetical protein